MTIYFENKLESLKIQTRNNLVLLRVFYKLL